MNFNIQIVYKFKSDLNFKKLVSRLEVEKLVFISDFFDFNDNQLLFIEVKEIDLLDYSTNNLS